MRALPTQRGKEHDVLFRRKLNFCLMSKSFDSVRFDHHLTSLIWEVCLRCLHKASQVSSNDGLRPSRGSNWRPVCWSQPGLFQVVLVQILFIELLFWYLGFILPQSLHCSVPEQKERSVFVRQVLRVV